MLHGFRSHFDCSQSHSAFILFMFAVQQAVLVLSVGIVYPIGSMTDSAVDGCIHLADRSGGSVASGSICGGSKDL